MVWLNPSNGALGDTFFLMKICRKKFKIERCIKIKVVNTILYQSVCIISVHALIPKRQRFVLFQIPVDFGRFGQYRNKLLFFFLFSFSVL